MAAENRGRGPTEPAAPISALTVVRGPNLVQRVNRKVWNCIAWLWRPAWDRGHHTEGPPGIALVLTLPLWLPFAVAFALFHEDGLGLGGKIKRLLFGEGEW